MVAADGRVGGFGTLAHRRAARAMATVRWAGGEGGRRATAGEPVTYTRENRCRTHGAAAERAARARRAAASAAAASRFTTAIGRRRSTERLVGLLVLLAQGGPARRRRHPRRRRLAQGDPRAHRGQAKGLAAMGAGFAVIGPATRRPTREPHSPRSSTPWTHRTSGTTPVLSRPKTTNGSSPPTSSASTPTRRHRPQLRAHTTPVGAREQRDHTFAGHPPSRSASPNSPNSPLNPRRWTGSRSPPVRHCC